MEMRVSEAYKVGVKCVEREREINENKYKLTTANKQFWSDYSDNQFFVLCRLMNIEDDD